jgi:hypothetical protein
MTKDIWSPAMAEIHSVKTTRLLNRQPSATFSGDAQHDPPEERTLYVLGLSVAGAIVASGILLIYFTSL